MKSPKINFVCSFFREDVNDIVRIHFAKKDETLYEALNRLNDLKNKMK